MHIDELREYCLSLPYTREGLPFDQDTLVFYVGPKMFCLTSIDEYDGFNVKCDPELAIELREKYPFVIPGFHMNKTHWNTIKVDSNPPINLLKEWIKHSYDLVFANLPKKTQNELKNK